MDHVIDQPEHLDLLSQAIKFSNPRASIVKSYAPATIMPRRRRRPMALPQWLELGRGEADTFLLER